MVKAIAAAKKGRDGARATVRGLCKQYGITMQEVKAYVLERNPRAVEEGVAVAKKLIATVSIA